jgi:hypothetical protein
MKIGIMGTWLGSHHVRCDQDHRWGGRLLYKRGLPPTIPEPCQAPVPLYLRAPEVQQLRDSDVVDLHLRTASLVVDDGVKLVCSVEAHRFLDFISLTLDTRFRFAGVGVRPVIG